MKPSLSFILPMLHREGPCDLCRARVRLMYLDRVTGWKYGDCCIGAAQLAETMIIRTAGFRHPSPEEAARMTH